MYSDDSDDYLPHRNQMSYSEPYAFTCGYGYWERTTNAPFRNFLANYVKVPIRNYGHLLTADYHNILYCPSMKLNFTPGDRHWNHRYGYAFLSFGIFNQAVGYGSSRMSRVGAVSPDGYWCNLVQDLTYVVQGTYPLELGQNNHHLQGGNAISGDGSGRWYPIRDFTTFGGRQYGFVRSMYAPTIWGANTTSGQLVLYRPPNGTASGLNHQPQQWPENRRFFGYRD